MSSASNPVLTPYVQPVTKPNRCEIVEQNAEHNVNTSPVPIRAAAADAAAAAESKPITSRRR